MRRTRQCSQALTALFAVLLILATSDVSSAALGRLRLGFGQSVAETAKAQVQRLQQQRLDQQIPPADFFSYKTTPAPPTLPGPIPQVLWVEQTAPPAPTSAAPYEACYGCDCLHVWSEGFLNGGTMSDDYTCLAGQATKHIPAIKWAGAAVNTGVGHPVYQQDGTQCTKSQSFAVVMEDLDWPRGIGEPGNQVLTNFVMWNIPGNWTRINDADSKTVYKGEKVVTVGTNDKGQEGMYVPCPEHGTHRYRITLWALRSYLPEAECPSGKAVDEHSRHNMVLPMFNELELAHTSFIATVKAPAYVPKGQGFLQSSAEWLREAASLI